MVEAFFARMERQLNAKGIAVMHKNNSEVAWSEANELGPGQPTIDFVGCQSNVDPKTFFQIDLSWVKRDSCTHDPLFSKSKGGGLSTTGSVMDCFAKDMGLFDHKE